MSEDIKIPEASIEAVLTAEQKQALTAVQEQVAASLDKDFIEEVTRNNVSEFNYKEGVYRVVRPNYQQKQEIYKERVKKFNSLLRDKEYILEKDLKKTYLERGIDIDGITKSIQNLEVRKTAMQIKLGDLLKREATDTDCEAVKTEIMTIDAEITQKLLERQTLLEFSLENQVLLHMYNHMTYIITERKDASGNWIKAFNTFDEFMKSDEELITKLAFLITMTNREML